MVRAGVRIEIDILALETLLENLALTFFDLFFFVVGYLCFFGARFSDFLFLLLYGCSLIPTLIILLSFGARFSGQDFPLLFFISVFLLCSVSLFI